jgi:ABC-type uncharacterized transport system involved in gliding motility auxiliary subunit
VELMATNKKSAARFAVVGLIIAIVGCIATGLLAIVQGTVALKLFTPPQPGLVLQWIAISAAVLLLGLAIYGILNPEGVRRFLSGRQARYGSNALIMAIAFAAILVIINVLVFQNPMSKDVTEDKQHTLAPETVRALATLPDKVTAIAFYSPQTPTDTAKQLLDNFKSNSKGKFDYRFVDPNSNPVLAHQYGITSDGKVVLTMGKTSDTAAFADESSMTQAMIRLISPEARTVYFLTGHGEPDINGTETTALSRARSTLESKNYTVKSLNLAATHKIPDDAKAIIEAGPTNPMLDEEVTLLKSYLAKGGSLVVLEDSPVVATKLDADSDPLANYLKTDWGIALDKDVVLDPSPNNPTGNGINAISNSFSPTSPITQHMTLVTVMPAARSLAVSQTAPEGVTLESLIMTANGTWGETDLASLQNQQQPAFDPKADIPGPLTVGASGENPATKSRLVVFGNSVFATDKGFDVAGNGDVFVNSIDWAAQQGNLINITPHTPIARTFNPPPQLTFIMILLGAVIVIPGLVVAGGLSNWLARRRRG